MAARPRRPVPRAAAPGRGTRRGPPLAAGRRGRSGTVQPRAALRRVRWATACSRRPRPSASTPGSCAGRSTSTSRAASASAPRWSSSACCARRSASSTRSTRGSTSTRSARWRAACSSPRRSGASASSPSRTSTGSWCNSRPTWCTSWSTGASLLRAMRPWRLQLEQTGYSGYTDSRLSAGRRRRRCAGPSPAAIRASALGTVLRHGERSSDGRRVGSPLPTASWPVREQGGAGCPRPPDARPGPSPRACPTNRGCARWGRASTPPARGRSARCAAAASPSGARPRRPWWRSSASSCSSWRWSVAATPTSGTATTRSTRSTSAPRWPPRAGSPSPSWSSARTRRVGESSSAAQAFGSASVVTGQRSDVVQLWRVTPSTKQIQIVSIPRDTVVTMLPPDSSQFGTYNRINASYNSGANQLVKTITANFGIPINHVVQVDFAGFQDAVNALGGIYLNFPYPAKDAYSGLDITTPGCQLLNGSPGAGGGPGPPLRVLRQRLLAVRRDERLRADSAPGRLHQGHDERGQVEDKPAHGQRLHRFHPRGRRDRRRVRLQRADRAGPHLPLLRPVQPAGADPAHGGGQRVRQPGRRADRRPAGGPADARQHLRLQPGRLPPTRRPAPPATPSRRPPSRRRPRLRRCRSRPAGSTSTGTTPPATAPPSFDPVPCSPS